MLIGHWAYQLPRQASPLPGRLGGPPEPFVGALQKGGHHPLPLEKCCAAAASPAEENRFSFMFQLLFDALEDGCSPGSFIHIAQALSLIPARLRCRNYTSGKAAQNKLSHPSHPLHVP